MPSPLGGHVHGHDHGQNTAQHKLELTPSHYTEREEEGECPDAAKLTHEVLPATQQSREETPARHPREDKGDAKLPSLQPQF